MATCKFCLISFTNDEKPTTLTQKGVNGLIKGGALYPNDGIPLIGDKIHEKCRKKRMKECSKCVPQVDDAAESQFTCSDCCMFCAKSISSNEMSKNNVHHVKAASFRETLCRVITERNDEWAIQVAERIENYPDFVTANCAYHQQCNVNFRTGRNPPNAQHSVQRGAPVNEQLNESFLKLVTFLEESNEPFSTSDLNEKFREFSGGEAYTVRYLKEKLVKHFGDQIIILSRNGLSDLVVMREISNRMIIESYVAKTNANRIIEDAANIVVKEIKSMKSNKETYPSPSEISSLDSSLSFIPPSLQIFLTTIFGGQKTNQSARIVSIGHAIIQVCRPRCLLSPIQLGLGIQVSVLTASRFLVDILHSLGFCCSYAEVRKYNYCASIANNQLDNRQLDSPSKVTKYVADNVDHNLCTLDGKGTFHGMGMISIEATENSRQKKIPRINVTMDDVKKINCVEIIHYSEDVDFNIGIKYKKLSPTTVYDAFNKLDLLWTLSWPSVSDRPAWSGFMQAVTTGSFSVKPTISFLPMIDLSSSNLTCIYSTMMFVTKEAQKSGSTPVLTFDQPLYWKARSIIELEPDSSILKRIVVMLGGFHMKMSYLGCIGYIMTASGLEEVFQQVYAPNSVLKMLSGKAIARAIRAHLLVYAALNAIISDKIFNESDKAIIATLYDNVAHKKLSALDLNDNKELIQMDSTLSTEKIKLQMQGATCELWIQYMKMLDIFRTNVRADRTANFQLHLKSVETMLPFFPAAGHNNYTKSIQIYLQDMHALKVSNPDVLQFFESGHFVTRRTNRFWGGLPDDLIIEQVLMRSLKSTGGLTRGTGFGEIQRTVWLNAMPSCGAINEAMQSLCRKVLETSEQHKELGLTRKKRDISDTKILYDYLNERNIFGDIPGLRNIVDGVVSSSHCNPNDAERIGLKILAKMNGNDSAVFVFRKKDQVILMNSKTTVQIDDENVQIDPEMLFQRLLFIQNNRNKDELESILQYELTQRPPVFFDERGFLRDGNELALADTLWKKYGSKLTSEYETVDECDYVLSGDWLIHEVSWQTSETFNAICGRYVEFVLRRYGKSATVVLSEVETVASIIDEKIIRSMKGVFASEISFTGDTPLKTKKQNFLNNAKNRNEFTRMLSRTLKQAGCNVFDTVGDPNVVIARIAASMSLNKTVIVVGEEANLLTLMNFYTIKTRFGLYLRCAKKVKSALNTRLWNIVQMRKLLGDERSKHLLFVHAFGGCQSTSHIFGIGEGTLYSKLDNKHFADQADVFCNRLATQNEIIKAGEQAMVLLFKGEQGQTLNKLRFEKYKEKATETGNVIAKRLPPTESATSCHSLRAYYQIQTWMQQGKALNPSDYGWREANNRLTPIYTNLPPAPSTLLSSIRCGCKKGCDTLRCNCKGAGLRCSPACKHCDHITCKNYDNSFDDEEDDLMDIVDYLELDC